MVQVDCFDLGHLFRVAGRRYEKTTGEQLRPYHLRVYLKFLRNWSFARARLQPELFQIVVGARASVDDNFAYAFFRLASHYPWQREESSLPSLSLRRRGTRWPRSNPRPRGPA